MDNRINLKKASIYYLVGTFFNKGIGFITVPIFTRILTVSDYGIVTTYNSWTAIISMFLSLALYMGIRLSFVDYENKVNDFLSTVLLFTVIYGFGIAGIVYIMLIIIPISINIGIVLLCILQALGSALIEDVSQFLLMKVEYKFRTLIMIAPNLISTILAIVVIRHCMNNNLYLGRIIPTSLTTFSIGVLLLFFFLPKGKIALNKEYLTYGLKISLPLVLHGIALNILSQSDRTMLTWLKNTSETGIYGLIYNFSMIATVLTTAFDGIWVPFFMEKMKKGNHRDINSMASKYIKLMSVAMIGVVFIGPEVVKILATKEYWEGITIIPAIVLSNYLIFIYSLYVYVEHYYKKTVFISVNTMIAAVINILLNYFFIIWWGYIGAAYSTLISYMISLVLHYVYSKHLNKDVLPLRQIIGPFCIVMSFIITFYLFIDNMIIRWCASIIIFVIMVCSEKEFLVDIVKKRNTR